MFKSFRTYNLAVAFYEECQKLKVRGAIRNQLERAALSIPLNLAEGRGRRTLKDQQHFFQIAYGSARECKAILDLVTPTPSESIQQADSLCAHLYRLIQNAK